MTTTTPDFGALEDDIIAMRTAMAERLRAHTRAGVHYWRQVPLLAVLVRACTPDYTNAGDTALTYAGSGIGLGGEYELFASSTTGELVDSDGLEVHKDLILEAVNRLSQDLSPFDGRSVTNELFAELEDSADWTVSTHRTYEWEDDIATLEVGLVSNWKAITGPLHTVSENMVRLANGWEGTFPELLATAISLADAQDAPELKDITVMSLL